MTILGIFINNEIRTGANRRYLELLEGLAERGNTVRVIMNSFLDYQPKHFEKISIPVRYTRHQFPPVSLLLSRRIRCVAGPRDLLKYPELLFETGNVSQIADMVERAITDQDYYQKLRDLCASRIPELTFDWVERFETEMQEHSGERA